MGFVFLRCCHFGAKAKSNILSWGKCQGKKHMSIFWISFQIALTCTSRNFSNSWDDSGTCVLTWTLAVIVPVSQLSSTRHFFSWVLYFYLYFTVPLWLNDFFQMKLFCASIKMNTHWLRYSWWVWYEPDSFYLPTHLSNKDLFSVSVQNDEICSKFLYQLAKIELKHMFWVYVQCKSNNSIIKICITNQINFINFINSF